MFYPAYIHSDSDGSASGFSLTFHAVVSGDSMYDAFKDARDALIAHFEAHFEAHFGLRQHVACCLGKTLII